VLALIFIHLAWTPLCAGLSFPYCALLEWEDTLAAVTPTSGVIAVQVMLRFSWCVARTRSTCLMFLLFHEAPIRGASVHLEWLLSLSEQRHILWHGCPSLHSRVITLPWCLPKQVIRPYHIVKLGTRSTC
jgi:hypothetical protein